MEDQKQTSRSVAVKGLAILGVIAVLLIGGWLAVVLLRVAPNAASTLASGFVSLSTVFSSSEKIVLFATDTTLASGNTFLLSWEHQDKDTDGSYTFSYFCVDDVYFTAPSVAGDETTIYCNTPFRFINQDDSLILIPYSGLTETQEVVLTIQFTPNGKSTPSLESSLSVLVEPQNGFVVIEGSTESTVPAEPEVPVNTPNTSNPVAQTPGTSQATTYPLGSASSTPSTVGAVDLKASVLAIGSVNVTTGEFTASSTVTTSQRAAIKFVVENVGTRTSGAWSFIAILPTRPFHTFTSAQQVPLNPGDKIEFTLGFDQIEGQRFVTTTITVDPTFQTSDADRANNVIRQQFEVILQ
jgi:hypothetical protein